MRCAVESFGHAAPKAPASPGLTTTTASSAAKTCEGGPRAGRRARPPSSAYLALLARFASARGPAPVALDAFIRFAKVTGGYRALSRVVFEVVALARALGFGLTNLREAPQEPLFRKVMGTQGMAEVVAEKTRRAEKG